VTICPLCEKKIRFWQDRRVSALFEPGKLVHTKCSDRLMAFCEPFDSFADLEQKLKRGNRVRELEMLYRAFPPEAQR
jgi:hypothetical protein